MVQSALKNRWICKQCGEEQYMSDRIMNSGTYKCVMCGNNEFLFEHNGVKHDVGKKRRIFRASLGIKEDEDSDYE